MKIVIGSKRKVMKFEDLDEGQTFVDEGEDQIKIKTDEQSGVCLEDGVLAGYSDDEKVSPVECELHITGK